MLQTCSVLASSRARDGAAIATTLTTISTAVNTPATSPCANHLDRHHPHCAAPTSALLLPPPLTVVSVPPYVNRCHTCPQHEPSLLHCCHRHPITSMQALLLPLKQASPTVTVLDLQGCCESPREGEQLRKCAVQSLSFIRLPNYRPWNTLSQTHHEVPPPAYSHRIG